jgi:hypothetical protein
MRQAGQHFRYPGPRQDTRLRLGEGSDQSERDEQRRGQWQLATPLLLGITATTSCFACWMSLIARGRLRRA